MQWLNLTTPSELWIYGPPGTGKSVLLSAVINYLQRHKHPTIYVFNSIREQDSTAPRILASLIQQMISLMPYSPAPTLTSEQMMTNPVSRLLEIFLDIASRFDQLFCCIDTMDECDETRWSILKGLDTIIETGAAPLKLVVTSRSLPNSNHVLAKPKFRIDLPNAETTHNIERLISGTISNVSTELASELVRRADGMFLWAQLALLKMKRPNADIKDILDMLPTSIKGMYRQSLVEFVMRSSTPDIELFCLILIWVATSLRPLRVEELQIAIAVDPSDTMLEELKLLPAPKESIVNICSPFLRIQTDDTVVPVHPTIQEFLRSSHAPSITISPQVNIPISSTGAYAFLASVCLTYLGFDIFSTLYAEGTFRKFKFLEYAACY